MTYLIIVLCLCESHLPKFSLLSSDFTPVSPLLGKITFFLKSLNPFHESVPHELISHFRIHL